MPYERPTLPDLASQAEAGLAGRLAAEGRLRRNVITVLARVWAGLVHGLYAFIDFLSRQLFPWTAESEYLERQAAWWGVYRKPPGRASGPALLQGAAGAKIPAGTILQNRDGSKYLTLSAAIIGADGRAVVAIQAETGGPDGNLPAGADLTLVNPVLGVDSQAKTAEAGLTGGVAAEDDAGLRARLLARVQDPPQGGTARDYAAWALAVPGVTRAWVYPHQAGLGSVGVSFVCDGLPDIIPTALKVAEVQAYLEDPIRKPVTADVYAFAPRAKKLDIAIKGLTPDTVAARAAVSAELRELLAREAEPGGRLLVSHIREAVSIAAGEWDHVLVSPTENVASAVGEIFVLGKVIFEV